jgi:mRNA-degrading endonuclease RelE of RelBE toxin-antitoxin system
MIVEFDKSFEKSLEIIRNKSLFQKLEKIIIDFENAGLFSELSNIKKLTGYKYYYRIRIQWRLVKEYITKHGRSILPPKPHYLLMFYPPTPQGGI